MGTDETNATANPIPARAAEQSRVRLKFLDGARGLAALYVVFHHAWGEIAWQDRNLQLPALIQHIMSFFAPGGFGVTVFIVLSSFCLMLPVVRTADLTLRGGAREYIRRRAFRILPPYYAALAVSLVLYFCFGDLNQGVGMMARMAHTTDSGNFSSAFVSHLVLLHNFKAEWAYKFNSPLWSVATEWQIYFFLPWVLLPVWKKGGMVATILCGFILGILPHFLFKGRMDSSSPWLLGSFALGMASAGIAFAPGKFETMLRTRIPWGLLTAISTAGLLLLNYKLSYDKYFAIFSICSSIPAFCFITYGATLASTNRKPGALIRLLEWGPVMRLGEMSYSLYLIHVLVVEMVTSVVLKMTTTPVQQMALTVAASVALSIPAAYAFHMLVERHFLTAPKSKAP